MKLKSERLSFRLMTLADGPFIVALLNQPSFIKNIGDRNVKSLEQAQEYIQKIALDNYERLGFGYYVVEINGVPIGICGFLKRDTLDAPDVGFAFLSPFFGQGYGTEATRRLLDYGRDELGLNRVLAITSQTNMESIRVLEKAGLKFEKEMQFDRSGPPVKVFVINLKE